VKVHRQEILFGFHRQEILFGVHRQKILFGYVNDGVTVHEELQ
jgi:hypothetical protein